MRDIKAVEGVINFYIYNIFGWEGDIKIYIYIFVTLLIARFGEKAEEKAEGDGGGNAACGGAQTTDENAEESHGIHSLLHALSKGIAKAGEGNGGACLPEINQAIIEADGGEGHPCADIEDCDPCGGPSGFINQNLSDGAKTAANEKYFEIIEDHLHLVFSFQMNEMGDGGDGFSLQYRDRAHQCPC